MDSHTFDLKVVNYYVILQMYIRTVEEMAQY